MSTRTILTMVVAALVLATGAWRAALWLDSGEAGGGRPLAIRIGAVSLSVPPAYIRDLENRRSGEFSEIDLAVNAADFRPAARPAKLRPGMEDASTGIIYFAIREQEKSIDPADRPARLYARFLAEDHWSHPGGLIMRRFEKGSPFEQEDLYIAPPEGRLFAARCMRPRQPHDGLPNTCVLDIRMKGLDIRLRFSPVLLADWERIVAGARGLMQALAR